jgi:hypothetical protein
MFSSKDERAMEGNRSFQEPEIVTYEREELDLETARTLEIVSGPETSTDE